MYVIATAVVLCVLCAVPATPQLITHGLHQFINSPSNTRGVPAVITTLFFELQW